MIHCNTLADSREFNFSPTIEQLLCIHNGQTAMCDIYKFSMSIDCIEIDDFFPYGSNVCLIDAMTASVFMRFHESLDVNSRPGNRD